MLCARVEKGHFGAGEDNAEFFVELAQFTRVWGAFGNVHQVVDVLNGFKYFKNKILDFFNNSPLNASCHNSILIP